MLPHVIFKRRTLPWERSPELKADSASWLALLLFEVDEAPTLQSVQAGDLQRQPFSRSADDAKAGTLSTSTLPATTACYADGYALLGEGDQAPAFEPGRRGKLVGYLPGDRRTRRPVRRHRPDPRRTGLAGPRPQRGADQQPVTGRRRAGGQLLSSGRQRLPAPNRKCVVHLVSLEGLAHYLPGDDGETAAPLTLAAGGNALNLRLGLAGWSFTSLDPQETFSGYLEGVVTRRSSCPCPTMPAAAPGRP